MSITFYQDRREALSVMREAARWLADTGRPLWSDDDLSDDAFSAVPEESFIVLRVDGDSAAVMLLGNGGSFDEMIWRSRPREPSGYIHKLSVRRAYAGQGYADRLIEHAVRNCAENGLRCLRLDCDPRREGLRRLYQRTGFSLVDTRTVQTKKLGFIDVALYERML